MSTNKTILAQFIANHQLVEAKEFEHLLVGISMDKFVFMQYKNKAVLDLICAKEVVQYTGEINNQKPCYNIIFLAPGCKINKEASLYAKSEEANRFTIADAIIVENALQRFLGNIYMNYGDTSRPTKLFSNVVDAKKWLKQC